MQLSVALLKTKIPYFVTLLLIAMYASYLYHGFFLRDILINTVVGVYTLLWPETIFQLGKMDEYNVFYSMPSYLLVAVIGLITFMLTNHFRFTSLNFIEIVSIAILMALSLGVMDRARYN